MSSPKGYNLFGLNKKSVYFRDSITYNTNMTLIFTLTIYLLITLLMLTLLIHALLYNTILKRKEKSKRNMKLLTIRY